jgi:hypothetical protein
MDSVIHCAGPKAPDGGPRPGPVASGEAVGRARETSPVGVTLEVVAHVKGNAALARLRYAREHHGEAGEKALLAALKPENRALVERGLLPQEWVPFSLFVDLNVKLDAVFGRGDLALVYQLGRYGADRNLKTIYRIFYKLGSPAFIISRATNVWSLIYDAGRFVVVPVPNETNTVLARIEGFPTPHRSHCLSVLGWAARSVELSGGTLLNAIEKSCRHRGEESCEFFLRWK